MRQPPPSRRRRLGVAAALRAFPELADLDDDACVVDTYEQRCQRPQDRAQADRHYSGKKKAHTLKRPVRTASTVIGADPRIHTGRLGA